MGLLTTLENWRGLPRCGIRAALRTVSMMDGQGMLRCDCKEGVILRSASVTEVEEYAVLVAINETIDAKTTTNNPAFC